MFKRFFEPFMPPCYHTEEGLDKNACLDALILVKGFYAFLETRYVQIQSRCLALSTHYLRSRT